MALTKEDRLTQIAVEHELDTDMNFRNQFCSALVASACVFTAMHWKKFLNEVNFSEKELARMPSKKWFIENVVQPATLAAQLFGAGDVQITHITARIPKDDEDSPGSD